MSENGWPGEPFEINVEQEVLDDLRERLLRTRFPKEQAGPDWATGTPLDYARRLRDHWLTAFDWRKWERRINTLDHRMIDVQGVKLHIVLKRGSGPNPTPLLMTNGWPGSFLEFIKVAERLAHPERFGGREEDAFTIIIPSLPGYGFSPAPAEPLSTNRIAGLWSGLMRELGLLPYVAYGSDWGSVITAQLALDHAEDVDAIFITSWGLSPTLDASVPAVTAEEAEWQRAVDARMRPESGYQFIQGTKPQSLAYGHTDSPMALACWIVEKFHGWTIPGETADPPFAMDDLLANVMLYWLNGALAPMWLYGFLGKIAPVPAGIRVAAKAGFLFSPRDLILPPPRSWLERIYDVGRVTVSSAIGHFPGMENAKFLADEIQTFMQEARSGRS